MKIVIVGIGKVGRALAAHLADEGHDIIAVDSRPGVIEHLTEERDVIGVNGNGASYEVLRDAGTATADLLIAATDSDEVNMIACLVAQKLGARYTIARIRNPEYERQLGFIRQELGLSLSINPERETARDIARILRFPTAAKVETFAKGRVDLVEYFIPAESRLAGMALRDVVSSLRVKVLVCAVRRGDEVTIPTGNFVLQAGDCITVTAQPQALESFFRELGVFKNRAQNVMIVGAGRITYYLAEQLLQMKMNVRIIDRDEECCINISEALPGALVIHGDATDHDLMAEEGLDQSDAFVALTGLDELNVMLSMYARYHDVDCAVAKVTRNAFHEIIQKTGIVESTVSPSTVTVSRILQYVRAMKNSTGGQMVALHRIVEGRVEAIEFRVTPGCGLIGVPFKDMSLKENLLIGCITHQNGEVIIPTGNDSLQEGDSAIVVTTIRGLGDLMDILA